jgi:ABC-type nitrate/sulfonate/bicarbonate transport system permease component
MAVSVRWVRGAAGIAVFLLLTEAAGLLGLIRRSALPLISSVLWRTILLAGDGRFLAGLGATVEAWAAGLAITVAAGVPLGVLLGTLPGVRAATQAVVEFLRPVPSVALILDIATGYLTGAINGPGIGAYIAQETTGGGNLTVILAATVWAGVLGLVLDAALTTVQRRLLRWHHLRLGEP